MKKYQVPHQKKLSFAKYDADECGEYSDSEASKKQGKKDLRKIQKDLTKLQEKLYASTNRSLLLVFQAMDTGGKDGTIKKVLTGINPQGFRISSFKKPTPLEFSHHFLWRIYQKIPPKGFIGVFNRSHYEDVLVPRVYQYIQDSEVKRRFEEIRDFEKSLHKHGTKVLKFYLNITQDEQKRRLQARLDDPEKHWKFNAGDLKERARWSDYQQAYEEALSETSTEESPWHIIPAHHKGFRNVLVAKIILAAMEEMNLEFPQADFDPKEITIE